MFENVITHASYSLFLICILKYHWHLIQVLNAQPWIGYPSATLYETLCWPDQCIYWLLDKLGIREQIDHVRDHSRFGNADKWSKSVLRQRTRSRKSNREGSEWGFSDGKRWVSGSSGTVSPSGHLAYQKNEKGIWGAWH